MKGFIIGVVVLGICVMVFGFYRGWFVLSSPTPDDGSNKVNVNMATDKDKIQEDVDTVKDKASELTGNSSDEEPETVDQQGREVEPIGVNPQNE
ncbi:MAG TPA: hypothetical protein VMM56_03710 [Planctomycetaceae bacterium]|nr:hypothetical protein [Planctomycetaceae bacterium]